MLSSIRSILLQESGVRLVANVAHSRGVPPIDGFFEEELEKYLLGYLTPGIGVLGLVEAERSFVFINVFREIKKGHLYFEPRYHHWPYQTRRNDLQLYPYEFRDRMAIPWSSVIFLALYPKDKSPRLGNWGCTGSYAGRPFFIHRLKEIHPCTAPEARKMLAQLLA